MEVNKLKQTMDDLKQALTDQILDLKPAPEPPADAVPFQDLYLDGTEKDNSRWRALLERYLAKKMETGTMTTKMRIMGREIFHM